MVLDSLRKHNPTHTHDQGHLYGPPSAYDDPYFGSTADSHLGDGANSYSSTYTNRYSSGDPDNDANRYSDSGIDS